MFTYKKYTFILLAGIFSLIFSCKKNEVITKSKLLSKSWKVEKLTDNGAEDNKINGETWTFKTDGTYDITMYDQDRTGKWAFNDTETILILDKGESNEFLLSILQLTDAAAQVSHQVPATIKESEKTRIYFLKK